MANAAAAKIIKALDLDTFKESISEQDSALHIILHQLATAGASTTLANPVDDVLDKLSVYQMTKFGSTLANRLNTLRQKYESGNL